MTLQIAPNIILGMKYPGRAHVPRWLVLGGGAAVERRPREAYLRRDVVATDTVTLRNRPSAAPLGVA